MKLAEPQPPPAVPRLRWRLREPKLGWLFLGENPTREEMLREIQTSAYANAMFEKSRRRRRAAMRIFTEADQMLRQAHPEPEPEQFPDRDYLLRNLRQRACLDILRDTKPEHRAEAMRVFRKADGMLAEPEPVKLGISREPETGDQR